MWDSSAPIDAFMHTRVHYCIARHRRVTRPSYPIHWGNFRVMVVVVVPLHL